MQRAEIENDRMQKQRLNDTNQIEEEKKKWWRKI